MITVTFVAGFLTMTVMKWLWIRRMKILRIPRNEFEVLQIPLPAPLPNSNQMCFLPVQQTLALSHDHQFEYPQKNPSSQDLFPLSNLLHQQPLGEQPEFLRVWSKRQRQLEVQQLPERLLKQV